MTQKTYLNFLNQCTKTIATTQWKYASNREIFWLQLTAVEKDTLVQRLNQANPNLSYQTRKIKNSEHFCILMDENAVNSLMKTETEKQIALIKASRDGNVDEIVKIIPTLLQINWRDNDNEEYFFSGATALHYAAEANKINAVSLLLDNGFDINAYDNSLWTPLFYAVDKGYPSLVEFLVEKGADILRKGKVAGPANGPKLERTVLHDAVGLAVNFGGTYIEVLNILLNAFKEQYVLNREQPVDINELVDAQRNTLLQPAFQMISRGPVPVAHPIEKKNHVAVLASLKQAGMKGINISI